MEYGGDPGYRGVDAQWIVEGPNSGGVKFYVLWRGHLFYAEQEFNWGTIGPGVAAAEFAARHRGSADPVYAGIVADLDALGLSYETD